MTQKILRFSLLTAAVLALVLPSMTMAVTVKNPNFEDEGVCTGFVATTPLDWMTFGPGVNGRIDVNTSSGTCSAYINANNGDTRMTQTVDLVLAGPVVNDREFVLCGHIGSRADRADMVLEIQQDTGGNVCPGGTTTVIQSAIPGLACATYTATCPADTDCCGDTQLTIVFRAVDDGSSTPQATVDTVTMTPVELMSFSVD